MPRRRKKRPAGPQRLGHVRWEGYDHRHLWNMIMDARPDEVFDRHYRWVRVGRQLADVNRTVQAELNTLFQTWQGTAAMSAALANTRLLEWSQETAETTQRIGEELGTYGNALVEARRRMPQPRHVSVENEFRAGEGGTVWSGPENAFTLFQLLSDHRATYQERAEARERAIEVMRSFEGDAVQVERRLDTYSTAPGTTRPTPTPLPWVDPGDEDGIGLPEQPDWPDTTTPAATTPASVTGPYGAGYGTGGYGVGGYGAGGFPGAGFGAGAGGADGAVRGGVPGTAFGATNGPPGGVLGATEAAAAARGAGAGTAGTARGAGAMMYPPMMGAGQDDEQEKRVAPYLVDAEDLFDDERTVAPPVFGA